MFQLAYLQATLEMLAVESTRRWEGEEGIVDDTSIIIAVVAPQQDEKEEEKKEEPHADKDKESNGPLPPVTSAPGSPAQKEGESASRGATPPRSNGVSPGEKEGRAARRLTLIGQPLSQMNNGQSPSAVLDRPPLLPPRSIPRAGTP